MLVHDENSDIIFITESWTAEHIGEAEINIPGYDVIRKDRMNKRGGGCLIYAKEELKVTVIDLANVENTESAWCLVKTRDLELVVGVCYLSPSAGVSLISERARTGTNRHESTEFAQHTSKHSMRTAWRHLTETCLHAPEMAALTNVAKLVV